jgi:hypothetical protein
LILARTGAVWDFLTDTGNYAVWDSGIIDIRGELRHSGRIRVRTRSSGSRVLRFLVKILPGRSVTWTWKLALGLAKTTRTVTLTDHGGFTHLHVTETTAGVLPRRLMGTAPDRGQLLREFVEAVKFRAELLGARSRRRRSTRKPPRPDGRG